MEMDMQTSPDLDMLFDLFNEDFCEDMERETSGSQSGDDDNIDDTSSESSGSSGRSSIASTSTSPSSPKHISTYYPAPPAVAFTANPLSSFESTTFSADSDCSGRNKRTRTDISDKIEDKLMRNRESANKSRLKRKNEKLQLEETVAALREQVRTLEMENTALLTDNTTLSQHNFFLQGMLKKQQEVNASSCAQSNPVAPPSNLSALSGISVLCVVFSISFFNDWLPSAFQGPAEGAQGNWGQGESSTGRVLLSVDDDDYSDSAYVTLMDRSQQPQLALHYILLLGAMFAFYCYIQHNKAAEKKSSRLLPS